MVAFATGLKEEYMSFKDIAIHHLEDEFNLERIKDPLMNEWLNRPVKIASSIREEIEQLRDDTDADSLYLNEAELRFYLVDPLIRLSGLINKKYRPFLERTLQGEVDGKKLRGKVDLVIARGRRTPRTPYLFIHEYKKEKGADNDPLAQLLSAMLVAQVENDNQKPVYGCYLIGKLWQFVILNGRKYSVSSGHVASNDDIFEIYQALVNMKAIIENELLDE